MKQTKSKQVALSVEERRSIVWATIERIAFRPQRADTNTWISLYEKTLPKLFGLQLGDVAIIHNTSFGVTPLNIFCKYNHEQTGKKYDAQIWLMPDEARLLWTIHVDPVKSSKASLNDESRPYPKKNLKYLKNDVETVLDGMVFHPRNHTHLEDCGLIGCTLSDGALKAHEIRVGGGIENVFVFLFHLRYQFCLVSEETRILERTRLTDLFVSAIKEKNLIPPKLLFDY